MAEFSEPPKVFSTTANAIRTMQILFYSRCQVMARAPKPSSLLPVRLPVSSDSFFKDTVTKSEVSEFIPVEFGAKIQFLASQIVPVLNTTRLLFSSSAISSRSV